MTNFIPLFPLALVAYPGEKLNLHIFEPRYKQLITDCVLGSKPFGIIPVINNKLMEIGTTVTVTNIVKTYDDGKMDISTLGGDVFNILAPVEKIPNKQYNGAIVNYPNNNYNGKPHLMQQLIETMQQLHKLVAVTKAFKKPLHDLNCYDIAHHLGLPLQNEYELLTLLHEPQRQEYLRLHLVKIIDTVTEIENLKTKVRLNGHFKSLKGFDFE